MMKKKCFYKMLRLIVGDNLTVKHAAMHVVYFLKNATPLMPLHFPPQ